MKTIRPVTKCKSKYKLWDLDCLPSAEIYCLRVETWKSFNSVAHNLNTNVDLLTFSSWFLRTAFTTKANEEAVERVYTVKLHSKTQLVKRRQNTLYKIISSVCNTSTSHSPHQHGNQLSQKVKIMNYSTWRGTVKYAFILIFFCIVTFTASQLRCV